MKNAVIALSTVLILAVVSTAVFFQKYRASQNALLQSRQHSESLNADKRAADQEIAHLSDEINRKEKRLQELGIEKKQINETLKTELSDRQAEFAELQNRIRDLIHERDVLKKEFHEQASQHTATISELESRLHLQDEQVSAVKGRLQDADSRVESLTEDLTASGNTVSELMLKIRELEEDKAALIGRTSRLTAAHDAALSELRQALQDRNAEMESLRQRFESEESKNRSLHTELSDRQVKVSELQNRIAALQQEKDRLKVEIENQKAVQKASISNFQQEIKRREDRIRQLRSRLQNAEALALSLGEKIERGQSTQQNLQELLSQLKQKEDRLQTKIEQLQSEYTELTAELKKEIDARQVTIQRLEEKLSITFVDRILFGTGKSRVGAQGREVLNRVGTVLNKVRDKKISVVGHTDNIPIEREYRHIFPTNWELSAARAAAVVRYLQYRIGLESTDLEVVGRSFYDPVAGNDTEEGRAKNRRVDIIIAPKLASERQ